MKKIIKARLENGERIVGSGFKFINDDIYVINDEGEFKIKPSTLSIFGLEDIKETENKTFNKEEISDFHNKIVEFVISYLKNNNKDSVDSIAFLIDGLKESVCCGEWVPFTDSSLSLYSYENNEKKLIDFSS